MAAYDDIRFCVRCGQPVELRQAFGAVRPVCPNCGRTHFVDPKVAAAVLLEREGKVLLVRRTISPEQGKWTLPAGFVDGPENPEEAALRETLEETGLRVRLTGLEDVISGHEHAEGASIVIVYRGEILEGEPEARDESDAVGFFGPAELPELAFAATRRVLEKWRGGRSGAMNR